jgi:hypothetical protein
MLTKKYNLALLIYVFYNFIHATGNVRLYNENVPKNQLQKYGQTKQAIILNTQIDDIRQLDPRLKSILMYAHYESSIVHIYYYSTDSRRYAAKLLELFEANKVNAINTEMISSCNLMEKNLIKIYLGEVPNVQTPVNAIKTNFAGKNTELKQ